MNPIVMTPAPPELEQQIRRSFSQLDPALDYQGCKVELSGDRVVVRIYYLIPNLSPMPYRVYQFDPAFQSLRHLVGEEAAPYHVKNYK